MNDSKDEVMNYSYIFAKDIFEYSRRKGKMEYFDANLVYNTIYDRHLLLTDNFPHTMIKTINDALKSKDPRELDKLEAWIDSSLDFNKLTDDELNYLFHKVGFYYNELLHYTIQEKAKVFREYIKIMYLIGNEFHKAKNRKPFKLMTISRILNNEHYTGIAHYEDGTYDNIYPKIIDKSIFEACRTKNQINNRRPRHFINNYILSGKLYCMECGLPMIGESGTLKQKVQYHYYKCTGRKRKLNDCKKHTVRQDYLEDLVIQEIHRFILQERFLKNVSIAMVEEYNKLVSNNPEIALAEKEVRRNANQINNLLNAIKDDLYNDLTKNELEKLQKEKQDLEIKLATLKNANNSPIDVDKCYHFLYSLLKLDLNLIANRKKLINTFVRKVMLSDEEIKILFYPLNKPGVFNESNRNLKKEEDDGDTSSSSVTVSPPTIAVSALLKSKAVF